MNALAPGRAMNALAQAGIVTLVSGAALSFAFSPAAAGPARMLPIVGASYALLAAGACIFLHRRGELREQLLPRRFDITAGGLIALVLFTVTSVVPIALLRGRPEQMWLQWLSRLYEQMGAAEVLAPVVGPAILLIAALEEIVWRGWVMRALQVAYGARPALFASAGLYALAHVATPFTLRAVDAGPNPLVIAAALICGLVWGAVAQRFERLGPSLFAHAIFSWATALFPLWRRG